MSDIAHDDGRIVDIAEAYGFMASERQFYVDIDEWLRTTLGYVPRVNWGPRDYHTGDNTYVNVVFRNPTDALLFRIQWADHFIAPTS